MALVSESARPDKPIVVKEQTALSPSGPVRVRAMKIVFMISGWARVQSPDTEVVLEAGSVLTIPAALECQGFPAGHARTVTFYLRPDYVAEQVKWLSAMHPLVHHLDRAVVEPTRLQALQLDALAQPGIVPALTRLARLGDSKMSEFELLGGVSDVFHAVGRFAGVTSGSGAACGVPRREVLTALSLLCADLRRSWRVDDLAHEVALSPSQLTRVFREHVGVSPAAFLRQLRTDRMAELLVSTDLNIGEAGAAVGFSDPASASRSFKLRYGVSPRAYAQFYRSTWSDATSLLTPRIRAPGHLARA